MDKKLSNRIVITLVLFLFPVLALASISTPLYRPTVDVSKLNHDIKIDGNFESTEWSAASIISNFTERNPGDNIQPLVNTETYITYDDENLYIAFKCFDNPADIRASMTQRDQYSGDDEVAVYIDTYGDASIAYQFYVNPLGIQKDYLWNPITGGDIGYDLIWESSGRITSEGYEIEMAIPFSSLRFPNNDVQSWKIDFRRNHPRESSHQYSWAAYDRDEKCAPCQWGTLEGIASVQPGKGIEILPAFVSQQNSERISESKIENHDPDGEIALSGKYSISSDVTLEGSINPDFSQIESDAAQIDINSTFSLFFPERRPFFQEGADIFRTLFNSFYTRTIFNPEVAVKMTGRPGKFRFGIVSAYDDSSAYIIPLEDYDYNFKASKSYVNIFRGVKTVGQNSRIGFMINDRRYEHDGSNSVLSVDGDISLTRSISWEGQFIYTHTKEEINDILGTDPIYYADSSYTLNFDGESLDGFALITQLKHFSKHIGFVAGYNQIEPTYRTQTGYDPVNNHRSANLYTGYTFYPSNSIFTRISPQFSAFSRWHFQTGHKKIQNFNFNLYSSLKYAQTNINMSYDNSYEEYAGDIYSDMVSLNVNVNSQPTGAFGYYVSVRTGESIARRVYEPSDELQFQTGFELKPSDRITIEPNLNYLKGDRTSSNETLYEQIISRTRLQYQYNKKLSLRLVFQYGDYNNIYLDDADNDNNLEQHYRNGSFINVDPLLTYRLNPFTVFYLGMVSSYDEYATEEYQVNKPPTYAHDLRLNQRKFFLKLQYLFQT